MNDNIVFGQYIHRNSVIHKLDPRTKLLVLVLLMVGIFLIPSNNFLLLAIGASIPFLFVLFLNTQDNHKYSQNSRQNQRGQNGKDGVFGKLRIR